MVGTRLHVLPVSRVLIYKQPVICSVNIYHDLSQGLVVPVKRKTFSLSSWRLRLHWLQCIIIITPCDNVCNDWEYPGVLWVHNEDAWHYWNYLTVRVHSGWGGSHERLPVESGVFMPLKLWLGGNGKKRETMRDQGRRCSVN